MFNSVLKVFNLIMSLKTSAQRLFAIMLAIIIILGIGFVYLLREIKSINEEWYKREAASVLEVRRDWAKDKSIDQKEIAGLRVEVKDEKEKYLKLVTDLWEDLKQVNNSTLQRSEKQNKLAVQNRRHVNIIKKDVKELIKK